MGPLFSTSSDRSNQRLLNKTVQEIINGNDEVPLPRADEQLAVLPSKLARIHSIYRLDGNQYLCKITGILCEDLRNVEIMGSNDPYVFLSFGDWTDKTAYQDGAGAEAMWENLKLCFPATDKSIKALQLQVKVYDYNAVRAHTIIGEADINLNSFVDHVGMISSITDHLGHETEIVVDIKDQSGKRAGKVVIYVHLEIALDVMITKVSCSELKNVEFMGENDPYVLCQFAGWKDKTAYIDGAGASCEWDHLRFFFQLSAKSIHSEPLKLQVFDYNNFTAHTFIGEGILELASLLENYDGLLTELSTELFDRKGRRSGNISLSIRLELPPDPSTLDPTLGAGSVERENECIEILSELKSLSDWGGNWRIMSMVKSNLTSTLVELMKCDYFIENTAHDNTFGCEHNVFAHAEKYCTDPKPRAAQTSILAIQIFKNLSMANLTGRIISDFKYGVLRVCAACFFAFAGTKRKARKAGDALDDIVSICWYLLDTHLERRSSSDFDRLLQSWKMTISDVAYFQEAPVLREFICNMIFTLKVYSARFDDPLESDIRRELEVSTLKFLMNLFKDADREIKTTNIQRLGVLRILVFLSTVPFNRETLILLDAHVLVLAQLEEACLLLKKDISRISVVPFPMEFIPLELYIPRGLSSDDKERMKQNIFTINDTNALTVKYCAKFLLQLTRHHGIIEVFKTSSVEPLLVRAAGVLLLSAYQSGIPEFSQLGLMCIASFAGSFEHGKIANLLASLAGRTAIKESLFSLYLLIRNLFGPALSRAVSLYLDPDYISTKPVKDYIVSISRIVCKELTNVEVQGENDPFVTIQFADWAGKTDYIDNGGSSCEWNKRSYYFPVTNRSIKTENLIVSVFDYNAVRANTLIGSVAVSLLEYQGVSIFDDDHFGKEFPMVLDIQDAAGVRSGQVTVYLRLEETIIASISRITCKDLLHVELMGHNDPYVQLDFGLWTIKTNPIDNAGAQADWNDLNYTFETTNHLLRANNLKIKAFDHNGMRSHTAIGEAELQLSSSINPNISRSAPAKQYVMMISRIVCRDLVNVEISGKNDPYVTLQFGAWNHRTMPVDGGGDYAEWNDLKLTFSTSDRSILHENMRVAVYDDNKLRSHVKIGDVSVEVDSLLDRRNKTVSKKFGKKFGEFEEYVFDITNDKGARTGQVVLYVALETAIKTTINRISCKGLKNVELFGKNDPYVKVSFLSWNAQTEYKDDAGSDAEWLDLGLSFMTSDALISTEVMKLSVFDYNDITSHAFIGETTLPLAPLVEQKDEEYVFVVDLMSQKVPPQKTGQITLYIKSEVAEDLVIDTDATTALTVALKTAKGANAGEVAILIDAEIAPERILQVLDDSNDFGAFIDRFIRLQSGYERLHAYTEEMSLPLILRAILELAKNELLKTSVMEGQPLCILRFVLEYFAYVSLGGTDLAAVDPKMRSFGVVNDGFVYELTATTAFSIDILLHLMCYVDLMSKTPITEKSVTNEMNMKIKAARNVYKTAREGATNEQDKKAAKAEFDKRAAKAKRIHDTQMARIAREAQWWTYGAQSNSFMSNKAKIKMCGDLLATLEKVMLDQEDKIKTKSRRFVLPPATRRHMHYLAKLLLRGRDGNIPIESVPSRSRTRVAFCLCHRDDKDTLYLSRDVLLRCSSKKDRKERATFDGDEFQYKTVEEEGNLENESYAHGTKETMDSTWIRGWEIDGRVNDLLQSLLKSGMEVIVDKYAPCLPITEKVITTGYDDKYPLLKAEILIDETMATCSALILCVTTMVQSHPGARYVACAAETLRSDERKALDEHLEHLKLNDTPDNPETRSRPSTAEMYALIHDSSEGPVNPMKIFYIATDTGLEDDNKTNKKSDPGNVDNMVVADIKYDGWVRDAMAAKKGKWDPDIDEDEQLLELVLPLWADEHIEATSMYIQYALH